MFLANPLTPECGRRLQTREHVCVGVSPFNGYFNQDRISALAKWAFENFAKVHFFCPDEAAAYTLMALGYDEAKARHKARRQGQYVVNKIRTAMAECGYENQDELILTASALRERPRFLELAQEARMRFNSDAEFRSECMTTTSWVLKGRLPAGQSPTHDQEMLAVEYFLDELPMFVDTAGIVGVANSTFVYHQEVAFLKKFYSHELGWKPADGQSFLVVTEAEAPAVQVATEATARAALG